MSDSLWLVACDLDQTLIYSRGAFRLPAGRAEPDLVVVEYLDGEPLSYLTRAAADGIGELAGRVPVVPVTTRTLAQYGRVKLGFAPAYAIAANGGHLLVDGLPDLGWEALVRRRLELSGEPLSSIRRLADELVARGDPAAPWVRVVREADDFFIYLVATERAAIPELTDFEKALADRGWTLSVQGRKVYLVPAALTKEVAIAEVLRRTGRRRLAAAGDSLLDLGMLSAAEAAVRPAHGELAEQGIGRQQLTVTDKAGILGGQEVIELLHRIVTDPGGSHDVDAAFRVGAG